MDFLFGGSALTSGTNGVQLSIPKVYGLVVLVAVLSYFVTVYLIFWVEWARKKFKVPHPTMYSATDEKFNCYQRAHQNTMEMYSMFVMLLLLGGLEWPLISAFAGLVWLAGRISYASGYYTGKPENRRWGSYSLVGLLLLVVATIKFGVHLLIA